MSTFTSNDNLKDEYAKALVYFYILVLGVIKLIHKNSTINYIFIGIHHKKIKKNRRKLFCLELVDEAFKIVEDFSLLRLWPLAPIIISKEN